MLLYKTIQLKDIEVNAPSFEAQFQSSDLRIP
jgi:hypothetical protein